MYDKPMWLNEQFFQVHMNNEMDSPFVHTSEDDLFGVEVELEGKGVISAVDPTFMKTWVSHPEGSLKAINPGDQTVEYVFRKPLTMSDTDKAILQLQEYMTKPGVEVYNTGRGSVHVHLNVINEKLSTIYNFLALSIIFDELLVSQNGASRIGNNFCLRVRDAEGFIVSLCDSISACGSLGYLKGDHRYSSINPMSLFKFGTIEFRSLECTVNHERIMHWIKTLQALKNAARLFKNPLEIVSSFSSLGPERFFLNILGAQAIKYMRVIDRHRMLFYGVRLCQEFANCADWTPITEENNPYKLKYSSVTATKQKKKTAQEAYVQALQSAAQSAGAQSPHQFYYGNTWQLGPAPTPTPPDAVPAPEGVTLEDIALEDEDFIEFEDDDEEDDDL